MTGRGTINKVGDGIRGVLTFPTTLGEPLVIRFDGKPTAVAGHYEIVCDATDELLHLAEGVLGGSVRRMGAG